MGNLQPLLQGVWLQTSSFEQTFCSSFISLHHDWHDDSLIASATFIPLVAFSRKKWFFTKSPSTELFSLFCIIGFYSMKWFFKLNVFITSVHNNWLLILRPGGGSQSRDHSIQGHVVTRDPGLDDSPSRRICLVTKLLQMHAKQMQKKQHITLSINPLRDLRWEMM